VETPARGVRHRSIRCYDRPDPSSPMCGRYAIYSLFGETYFDGLDLTEELKAFYNVCPTQDAPIVRAKENADGLRADLARWGLVPSWADDPKIGARMINARAETAATKPSFRAAFERRRCLVPANGFYEWQRRGGGKVPHYVTRADGAALAFAGLWERWRELESFTILTTDANAEMQPVHDRMPVVLDPRDYDTWLAGPSDADAELLGPCPDGTLALRRVSTYVNKPGNEGPRCIEPVEG